jgi:oxygen-dependent protoporphyrinogen oxidase
MIAIIGAGITGLATGYHLQKAGIPFHIFEASDRVGGNLRTVRSRDCLLEKGPNSLLMNDRIHALLEELGIAGEIIQAGPQAKYRYVLRGGRYQRLPSGPISFLMGSFFSKKEKWEIWKERKNTTRSPEGETVDAFFRRRLGNTVADYVLNPFVAGIYAGDPKQLEIAAAFPRFLEMEQQYGSVIRGAMKGGKRDQHRGIFSLKPGLERLPQVLAEKIGNSITTQKRASEIRPSGNGVKIMWDGGGEAEFDKVILTVPAHVLPQWVNQWDAALGQQLADIYYPPVALVHTLWKKEQIGHALDGFGALHSAIEPSYSLGTIFSTSVFAGRNPEGTVLLTSFVGGARDPHVALMPEADSIGRVQADFSRFLGVKGEPLWGEVAVYEKAIPQYRPGIRAVWERAALWEQKGIHLEGNWREGISVPNCLDNARLICEKLTR